jgi:hypothetical protein
LTNDAPQTLSAAEAGAERAKHIHLADSENRIDGISRDPRTDAIFTAYVAGEIALADIVRGLPALLGL